MKSCSKCKKEYPATKEFFVTDKRNASGLGATCRVCSYAYAIKHRKESPRRFVAYRKQNLKRYYGVTLEQYDRMFAIQNGVCATCGKPETARNQYGLRRLAVDHDHATGEVRGLLCTKCNRLLGLAKDNTETLARLIVYLRKLAS